MTIAAPIANSLQRASWIRQMFEAGAQLKQQYGADQIFDFSDAIVAHERMLHSQQMGKIVLRFA